MQFRTCKYFIRFVLLLIIFQFLSSSITQESGTDLHKVINAQYQKSLLLSFFFEENKNERDDERLSHSVELFDLSLIPQALTRIHTEVSFPNVVEARYQVKPALFKLHRNFII